MACNVASLCCRAVTQVAHFPRYFWPRSTTLSRTELKSFCATMRSLSFVVLEVISCAVCSSGFTANRRLRTPLLFNALRPKPPTSSQLDQNYAASRLQQHPLWQPERTFEPAAKRLDGAQRCACSWSRPLRQNKLKCLRCLAFCLFLFSFLRLNFETFSRYLRDQPTLLRQHALAITAVVGCAVLFSSFSLPACRPRCCTIARCSPPGSHPAPLQGSSFSL